MTLVENYFTKQLSYLGQYEIYRDGAFWTENHNVWKRPLRPQSFPYTDFQDVSRENLLNYSTFTLNRILTVLYEQDFLYLPESSDDIVAELRIVYNKELREEAAVLIPELERKIFCNLKNEIKVGGEWSKELFQDYFITKLERTSVTEGDSIDMIHQSSDLQLMARFLLMQHAVDFLPESSHMVRFAKGDYGEIQSALFRVLLDEFGYGKHSAKHSSLFKETLKSVNMYDNSHAYWSFYLNSSLLNNNYFHMLTRNPENFFEYIGAITYAENSFGPYCGRVKSVLKYCFPDSDTRYYSEHEHIDGYHGDMTLNEILIPLADRFGSNIYREFVKGIEMTCALQKIMEDDLKAQITWMENRNKYLKLAMDIKKDVLANIANIPVAHLNEHNGELSVPHVHDGDEFCIVDEGVLRFCHGPDCFTDLEAGQCVVIAKNRLHGALVLSEYCKYRILSIGDYRQYANYII
ncbi:cupin [Chania multitudinisentens RB-25]|uniref:Cupin n=1 Tax=Chania multitudinisentens RB-25 TaxID=1441930 RepID=W0LAG3_9GAMM|nr:iron-containing redox enzyme family protein [Chania multitudinisentens]AHG20828.1 cupin [Chania multitudinisentens RB-25]